MYSFPFGPPAAVLCALSLDDGLLEHADLVRWLCTNFMHYEDSHPSFAALLEAATTCMFGTRTKEEIRMILSPLCPHGLADADWQILLGALVCVASSVSSSIPFADEETMRTMMNETEHPGWPDVPEPQRAFYRCCAAEIDVTITYLRTFIIRAVRDAREKTAPCA